MLSHTDAGTGLDSTRWEDRQDQEPTDPLDEMDPQGTDPVPHAVWRVADAITDLQQALIAADTDGAWRLWRVGQLIRGLAEDLMSEAADKSERGTR